MLDDDYIYGMPAREVIAMAQMIREGHYSPDDLAWSAFKAGYELGWRESQKYTTQQIERCIDDMVGQRYC